MCQSALEFASSKVEFVRYMLSLQWCCLVCWVDVEFVKVECGRLIVKPMAL